MCLFKGYYYIQQCTYIIRRGLNNALLVSPSCSNLWFFFDYLKSGLLSNVIIVIFKELHKIICYYICELQLSPPQRLPLGIPMKIAIIIVPCALSFFSSQSPHNTKRGRRRGELQCSNNPRGPTPPSVFSLYHGGGINLLALGSF